MYKQFNIDQLLIMVKHWKDLGKIIVWTNGCFDLFHPGHLRTLKIAKTYGDILIVGVNSNESVFKLKGANRPIIDEVGRIDIISELTCVDAVILMQELAPCSLIEKIQPNFCCKGEEYLNKEIPEIKVISSYGGQIKFIPRIVEISTSCIINKIKC